MRTSGLPRTISDDAREGFDITLDKITGLPDDAALDDLESINELTDEEKAKTEALDKYIAEECAALTGETGR